MWSRMGVARLGMVIATAFSPGCGSYSPPREDPDAGIDAVIDAGPDAPACEGDSVVDVVAFGRQFYGAVCSSLVRCDLFTTFRTVEECRAHYDRYYDGVETKYLRSLTEAAEHRILSLDAAAASRCFAELTTGACPVALDSPSCGSMFTGSRPPGAACFTDEECAAAGGRCVGLDAEATCRAGTCSASAALGQPCSEATPCVPGAHCVAAAGGGAVCETGDPSARCGENRDCDRELWCKQGSCAADLGLGERCRFDAECTGGSLCVGELAGAGVCSKVTAEGDVCDDYCFGAMYCDVPQLGQRGTCHPLPKLGESCLAAMGRCGGFELQCSNQDLCAPAPAQGEACVRGSFCQAGFFCSTELSADAPAGTCLPLAAVGQRCARDGNCASYHCGGDGTCRDPEACLGAPPAEPCP